VCGMSLRSWVVGSDGAGAMLFHVPPGESAVSMQGRELFRFASQKGGEMLREACSLAGLSSSEVDCVLIHQANLRIIECLQERTGISPDRWLVNIGGGGETATAAGGVALSGLLCTRAPAGCARKRLWSL